MPIKSKLIIPLIILLTILLPISLKAQDTKVKMFKVSESGINEEIGLITLQETTEGILFTPNLKNLPAGERGFHIHSNPSCEVSLDDKNNIVPAGKAGSHYDPDLTNQHLGPQKHGHKGDLPKLLVNKEGIANTPILFTKYKKLTDINNLSLIIHEGSDNYEDTPQKLGGGGKRIACGIIK